MPHHDCCFKIYAFFGIYEVTLRQSLNTADIFRSSESDTRWQDNLDMISRVDLDSAKESSLRDRQLLPPAIIELLSRRCDTLAGMRCVGVDVVVEEESMDVYIIDLNDMPSYKGVPSVCDRAFNALMVDKVMRTK